MTNNIEFKQIPFLRYLNLQERNQVELAISSKIERIEQYSKWIKEGYWEEVVKAGTNESDCGYILMGAHALQRIDSDEITAAMQFIDVSLEDREWTFERTDYPNIRPNLNIRMIPSYPLTIRDRNIAIRTLPCIEADERAISEERVIPLLFKIVPVYKMPNIYTTFDQFKNRNAVISVKELGKNIIFHGNERDALANVYHDFNHYLDRNRSVRETSDSDFFHKMVVRHCEPVIAYLKTLPPYTVKPKPTLGSNDWTLPENASSTDRKRHALEQLVLKLTENTFSHLYSQTTPRTFFEKALRHPDLVLTDTERAECLKELSVVFGPVWEQSNLEAK